ncbi:MAG: hypothetical protein F4026_01310, partial [Synechococcus sp. SB0669_bin_8]|nr:hypothetical protein [Synechococcus sp. SB0675_bin_6]MYJ59039.1 hypothetical protein [Synechococcus sp. SB0672_bin_6]MYK90780.1 hypothetical protein [Synechococcus sp. SB0669_bin_8]
MFLAPLLALPALLAGWSSEAAAQTTRTLVSNVDQTTATGVIRRLENDYAQMFETGSDSNGYLLTSVEIPFKQSRTDTALNISIHKNYSDAFQRPVVAAVGTLTSPTFVSASDRAYTFTTSGIKLEPDTKYWVVLDSLFSRPDSHLTRTTSSDEDSGSLPDWKLGSAVLNKSHNTRLGLLDWGGIHSNESLKIRLKGRIDYPEALLLSESALTVAEGASATYTVQLKSQPSANVDVTISGQAGTDVTVQPSTFTFTPGNWNSAQTVTVKAAHDNNHNNERVTLVHTAS